MTKDETVAGKPIGFDHPDGSVKVYVEIIFLSSIKGCAAWFDSPAAIPWSLIDLHFCGRNCTIFDARYVHFFAELKMTNKTLSESVFDRLRALA